VGSQRRNSFRSRSTAKRVLTKKTFSSMERGKPGWGAVECLREREEGVSKSRGICRGSAASIKGSREKRKGGIKSGERFETGFACLKSV